MYKFRQQMGMSALHKLQVRGSARLLQQRPGCEGTRPPPTLVLTRHKHMTFALFFFSLFAFLRYTLLSSSRNHSQQGVSNTHLNNKI